MRSFKVPIPTVQNKLAGICTLHVYACNHKQVTGSLDICNALLGITRSTESIKYI